MGQNGGSRAVADLLRRTLFEGGRQAVVTVASSSMEPSLHQGDRLTIENISSSRLRRGDIVVYESPLAGLVVHRLMWKVPPVGIPRVAFTKGDALLYLDRPFAVDEIVGKVVAVETSRPPQSPRSIRRVGRWQGYLKWLGAAATWGWRRGWSEMGLKALIRRGNR
ncbi:MAG: signal peptidase I [Acidobacteria bacterium]|nr:signal peptidase I [Acidobacteriota bacterium]